MLLELTDVRVLIIELDVWKWGDFLNRFKTESTRKLSTVNTGA